MKCYGNDGMLQFTPPANVLQNVLRVTSLDALIGVLDTLPGCKLEEIKPVTIGDRHTERRFTVTIENWHKYQIDSSVSRTRRYRIKKQANVTILEEKRRDVEEKRREEMLGTRPALPSQRSTAEEKADTLPTAKQLNRTLKINGKLVDPDPEIPDSERMSPEEMEAIKLQNMRRDEADVF